MHTEHRPNTAEDSQRIPIGEGIPEPVLAHQGRVEDRVGEESGNQRRRTDRNRGSRDPVDHPADPPDVERQHPEEEQRQPVKQRARVLRKCPAHRVRPVGGEQRPAAEAGHRDRSQGKGSADPLQGPSRQSEAQPDNQRHLSRSEARGADIEAPAPKAQEDRQSARQQHDEQPAGLLEALALARVTARFARHRTNNDLGGCFVRRGIGQKEPSARGVSVLWAKLATPWNQQMSTSLKLSAGLRKASTSIESRLR